MEVASILRQLHMLKGSDIIGDNLIIKKVSENFRVQKPDEQTPGQFYDRFVQDFENGKYTAYLLGREGRRAFYNSPEWQSLKKQVMKEQPNVCVICGSTKQLSVDHIVSRYKDKSKELDITNMQIMCLPCNTSKSWK